MQAKSTYAYPLQAIQLNFSILEIIQHIIISQMRRRGETQFEIGDTEEKLLNFHLHPEAS